MSYMFLALTNINYGTLKYKWQNKVLNLVSFNVHFDILTLGTEIILTKETLIYDLID